jgi:hypothetical protein
MDDGKKKTAPCRICGKALTLPPWPIVESSLQCLEHSTQELDPHERVMLDLVRWLNEGERERN